MAKSKAKKKAKNPEQVWFKYHARIQELRDSGKLEEATALAREMENLRDQGGAPSPEKKPEPAPEGEE